MQGATGQAGTTQGEPGQGGTDPGPPLRVVLADDHPVVRAGVRTLLEAEPGLRLVAEYGDLPTLLRALAVDRPDLLLLDLTMGASSTLPAIPDLLAARPGLKVIVLTMHDDPALAREALRQGAVGYVLKEAVGEELVLAVRSAVRGTTYLHPSLGARIATVDEQPGGLTDREVEILRLITAGHTNTEISRRLYLSLRTVESHRGRLRAKLNLESRAELTRWAQEHGLIG